MSDKVAIFLVTMKKEHYKTLKCWPYLANVTFHQ